MMKQKTKQQIKPMTNQSSRLDIRKHDDLQAAFSQATVVLQKDYLGWLQNSSEAELVAAPQWMKQWELSKHARFYQVDKLTYTQQESVIDKLATVFNATYYNGGSIALVLKSNGTQIEYYIGIIQKEQGDLTTAGDVLQKALQGNFPGSQTSKMTNSKLEALFQECFMDNKNCISSISGVASDKFTERKTNEEFLQGLEKLIDGTKGQEYTLLIVADPIDKRKMQDIRSGYEVLYSQLAPFEKTELSFQSNDSMTMTMGTNNSYTEGINSSSSLSKSHSQSHTVGSSDTETKGKTSAGLAGTIGKAATTIGGMGMTVAGAAMLGGGSAAGAAATAVTGAVVGAVGAPVAAAGLAATVLTGIVLSGNSKNSSKSKTTNKSESNSETQSKTSTTGKSESWTSGDSQSESISQSSGQTIQISGKNRSVQSLLEKIDDQLKRMNYCETYGMYGCAAYVISNNTTTNHIVASTYNALMRGEESGTESSAVNTWYDRTVVHELKQYLSKGFQPEFRLIGEGMNQTAMVVTPASMVSSRELAIHMGLPKKSVPGLPVIETAAFGRNVYRNQLQQSETKKLGQIYHMGAVEGTPVSLDLQSLTAHTFVTGSTGAGKSNTIYHLLNELRKEKIKFMVVEPAKGEYKHVLGQYKDVSVYGTNPKLTKLLRINPFSFPESIHVYEHMDRLVEIFNVCWPMYAAMPAVLKEAVGRAYEAAGWDLEKSENKYSEKLFPTFTDVLYQIENVINESEYSADSKGDYKGALITRIRSLTNGINSMIFSPDELGDKTLFDQNTVIDLSRIGSTETKSLIMGLLVMKLQEYRMSQPGMNAALKHVTVLEEAHNLLKRTSTEQSSDSSNLLGKSVEMLTNAIAEMRTYGEGFIIADQAPGLLDMAVIRNTNTKIILRLPEQSDRELVGKACGLNDEQIKELAKLEKGVAAVYQNDWIEAVLCKIAHYGYEEALYQAKDSYKDKSTEISINLLDGLVHLEKLQKNIEQMLDGKLLSAQMPVGLKCAVCQYANNQWYNEEKPIYKIACELLRTSRWLSKALQKADNAENGKNYLYQQLRDEIDFQLSQDIKISEKELENLMRILVRGHKEEHPEDRKIIEKVCGRVF